ncbi:unnamed protein product [Ceratitis capitata]|uniref:(Mediterranean fruit fly) hypothetical protein n=1 Tax=Ceratitis capitata TaxID=7213 RepID=A0A811VAB5_CERCA|nr:unnamed protein product [Ceratitis capitata]
MIIQSLESEPTGAHAPSLLAELLGAFGATPALTLINFIFFSFLFRIIIVYCCCCYCCCCIFAFWPEKLMPFHFTPNWKALTWSPHVVAHNQRSPALLASEICICRQKVMLPRSDSGARMERKVRE